MAGLHSVQHPVSDLVIIARISIPGSPDWVGIDSQAVWASKNSKKFALVDAGMAAVNDRAPIELVLASGNRLRIAPGADAATLRTVLRVLQEPA